MKTHARRWGAVYLLALMFLGSWLAQLVSQAAEVARDAKTHGETFMWSDFWPQFFAATFENWQSEFLQLLVQSVLIASFWQRYVFQADHSADKDDVDKIMKKLDRLLDR